MEFLMNKVYKEDGISLVFLQNSIIEMSVVT